MFDSWSLPESFRQKSSGVNLKNGPRYQEVIGTHRCLPVIESSSKKRGAQEQNLFLLTGTVCRIQGSEPYNEVANLFLPVEQVERPSSPSYSRLLTAPRWDCEGSALILPPYLWHLLNVSEEYLLISGDRGGSVIVYQLVQRIELHHPEEILASPISKHLEMLHIISKPGGGEKRMSIHNHVVFPFLGWQKWKKRNTER